MSTVETLRLYLEHAPRDPGKIANGLLGWNTADGHFVCNQCAGRIMARGCQFPAMSMPVWDDGSQGRIPAGPCCCCQPPEAAKPAAAQVSPEAAAKIIAAAVAIFQSVECVNRGVWQVPHAAMRKLVAELTAAGVEV